MSPSGMAMVSVLICTYNRPHLLAQCLAALSERTSAKPDQIVVVNGGDERTDRLVQQYIERSPIRFELVNTRNHNLATSRNAGLPHCTGDIIAMTDDDAEVFPDWVAQLKRIHAARPSAGAVGGPVVSTGPPSLLSAVADRVTFPSFPQAQAVRTLPGVNIAYKREAVERVGLQDPSLFRGEDVDYNWRVQQAGYEVYYDPTVRVRHQHRATLRALLRQHYMYGRAYYLVRRKWPQMYCIYPHRLSTPKDVIRALYFVAAVAIEPARYAAHMDAVTDKLLAYPVLLANQIAWRGGMIRERMAGR